MKKFFFTAIAVLLFCLCFTACSDTATKEESSTSQTVDISTVVPYDQELTLPAEHPHSTDSFTQGLFFYNGFLYESTGRYAHSKLMKNIDIKSGESEAHHNFDDSIFAEGSTVFGSDLYVLTWKENKAFVFDPDTLELKNTLDYPRQGWGLTTDGNNLIASDGTANIYFMDGKLNTLRTIEIKRNGEAVRNINELEYIDGKIWANVWMTDEIIIINPDSGEVEKTLDFSTLNPQTTGSSDDVLNGIAYDSANEKIYITGKRWDTLYELELKEAAY